MFIRCILVTGILLAGPPSMGHPHRDVPREIVVDQGGQGDFTTIQAAINSLPAGDHAPEIIFVRDGTYPEKLLINKSDFILAGESRDRTVITQSIARDAWRCDHPGDWGVATVNISGSDITLENLTIENSYGFRNHEEAVMACAAAGAHDKTIPRDGHQMALRTMSGTRICAVNVHFRAFGGDTVSPWNVSDGMFCFKNCLMEGGVDFYCPRGWAYAEDCHFYSNTGPASIWHDGSGDEDEKTVLKDCTFDGYPGFDLGRYHKDAQFYLVGCRFSKNMADRDIYRVPTTNVIRWGRRVYYARCHRRGGDYTWFRDNLGSAPGHPVARDINAEWVFRKRWNPFSQESIYHRFNRRKN